VKYSSGVPVFYFNKLAKAKKTFAPLNSGRKGINIFLSKIDWEM
jgi:hypothetical protein